MTKRAKLMAKICTGPAEADFEDVRMLLKAFGYMDRGGKGSHHVFVKEMYPPIIVPTVSGRRVKRHYLDKLCETLNIAQEEGHEKRSQP